MGDPLRGSAVRLLHELRPGERGAKAPAHWLHSGCNVAETSGRTSVRRVGGGAPGDRAERADECKDTPWHAKAQPVESSCQPFGG
jgi:hypothetical protein